MDKAPVTTTWSDGTSFTADAKPVFDILKIEDNATISFLKGIAYHAKCNKLIMGKNVTIVCSGLHGLDSIHPGSRPPDVPMSGTPAQHQYEIHPRFLRYAQGVDGNDPQYPFRTIGYPATPPTAGTNGAHATITYDVYQGYEFDKVKQVKSKGGEGGKGAKGGEGATVLCTRNPCGGVLQGPLGLSTSDAPNGHDGSFFLIDTTRAP